VALDQLAREQDTKPYLRFATVDAAGADPRDETEAVGDDDPVKTTGYGIKNIKRLIPMLAPATTNPTEDNSDLKELYGRLFGQWTTELRHVAAVVGGVESQEKYGSQPGARFTPIAAAPQRAAVRFLNENAFQTPTYFLRPEILNRMEPMGAVSRVVGAQSGVLNTLLSNARLGRMIEFEASAKPGSAYTVTQLFSDVRGGVWGELNAPAVKVDVYRRGLQHAYIDAFKNKVNPPPPPTGLPAGFVVPGVPPDVRALARQELKTLDGQIAAAQKKAGDPMTRAHLDDLRHEIDDALNPKK